MENLDERADQEKAVLDQLILLGQKFHEFWEKFLEQAEKQCQYIERIWLLTQRYLMIVNPPCLTNISFYPKPTEELILHEYNIKLKAIKISNCLLLESFQNLMSACKIFEKLYGQLNMRLETELIVGNMYHKPLTYFIELVHDLCKYFHALVLKLKYKAALFDPMDLSTLEDYKILLKPKEEFVEYLETGLTYCKCLKEKPDCQPQKQYPCLKKLPVT